MSTGSTVVFPTSTGTSFGEHCEHCAFGHPWALPGGALEAQNLSNGGASGPSSVEQHKHKACASKASRTFWLFGARSRDSEEPRLGNWCCCKSGVRRPQLGVLRLGPVLLLGLLPRAQQAAQNLQLGPAPRLLRPPVEALPLQDRVDAADIRGVLSLLAASPADPDAIVDLLRRLPLPAHLLDRVQLRVAQMRRHLLGWRNGIACG